MRSPSVGPSAAVIIVLDYKTLLSPSWSVDLENHGPGTFILVNYSRPLRERDHFAVCVKHGVLYTRPWHLRMGFCMTNSESFQWTRNYLVTSAVCSLPLSHKIADLTVVLYILPSFSAFLSVYCTDYELNINDRDSSVGIAIRLGLDGSWIETRRMWDFRHPSNRPWGPLSLL